MSLRRSIEQLRPARTQKVDLQEKVQILLQEARGSGGGAEGTKTTECAQCVYAAAIFNGEKLKVGDKLDPTLFGNYASKFEIDESKLFISLFNVVIVIKAINTNSPLIIVKILLFKKEDIVLLLLYVCLFVLISFLIIIIIKFRVN